MIPDKSVEILLGELSRDIAQRTPGTGDFPTAVEGLELFRRNEPAPPVSCLVPPSIVLVADGAKIMWVGGEPYEYNAEKFLITSLDLPASSEILQASTSQPCVGVAAGQKTRRGNECRDRYYYRCFAGAFLPSAFFA